MKLSRTALIKALSLAGVLLALGALAFLFAWISEKRDSFKDLDLLTRAKVPAGYGCPPILTTTLRDFKLPQGDWKEVAGYEGEVWISESMSEETFHPDFVNLEKIKQNGTIADPSTLHVYFQGNANMYAADSQQVYLIEPNHDDYADVPIVSVVKGADPETFKPFQEYSGSYIGFARDRDHVYLQGVLLEGVIPAKFRPLGWFAGVNEEEDGSLTFITVPYNDLLLDGPLDINRRPLEPIEARYMSLATEISLNGNNPVFAFSELGNYEVHNGRVIRVSPNREDSDWEHEPEVFGVFWEDTDNIAFCFAAQDGSVITAAAYESNIILEHRVGPPNLIAIDMRDPILSPAPFAFDYSSSFAFDEVHKRVLVLQETWEGGQSSFSLVPLPFADLIGFEVPWNPLISRTGESLSVFTLAADGQYAAALHATSTEIGPGGYTELVLVDLASGVLTPLVRADRGWSTFVPVFFSADSRILYYYLSVYEGYGNPSPLLYAHPLDASADAFGTEAELTPLRHWERMNTDDNHLVYYFYPSAEQNTCSSEYFINDRLAVYDTVTGNSRDLAVSEPGTAFMDLELDRPGHLRAGVYRIHEDTNPYIGACVRYGEKLSDRWLEI